MGDGPMPKWAVSPLDGEAHEPAEPFAAGELKCPLHGVVSATPVEILVIGQDLAGGAHTPDG